MRTLLILLSFGIGTTVLAAPPPGSGLLGRATAWITTSYWETTETEAITEFRSTWKVPAAPPVQGDQLIYLFNGMTDKPHNAILQPVLQWGVSPAGGGPYWAVASWYVTMNAGFRHTPLQRVQPGDTLVGVMKSSSNGGKLRYESTFEGINDTTLVVDDALPLVWLSETLEAYKTTGCSDYPPGSVDFSDIWMRSNTGIPNLLWKEWTPGSNCGQRTEIVDGSPSFGLVRIRMAP